MEKTAKNLVYFMVDLDENTDWIECDIYANYDEFTFDHYVVKVFDEMFYANTPEFRKAFKQAKMMEILRE